MIRNNLDIFGVIVIIVVVGGGGDAKGVLDGFLTIKTLEKCQILVLVFMMKTLERQLELYMSIWGVICFVGKLTKKTIIHTYTLKTRIDFYFGENWL